MNFIKSWVGWRQYSRLDEAWKKIVFYSESGQDWHHFEGLIRQLLDQHDEKITYVSSDQRDPGLLLQHKNYRAICIPPGLGLIVHFQVQRAGVVIMTMMDLGNLQLKKSLHPVHYLYLFHSMGSTHMVDHANSYDGYDSLFCVGPHHVAELRKREALAGIAPRHLFEYGYPRLEQLQQQAQQFSEPRRDKKQPVVLIAPTWGENSIFNRCGETLVENLLSHDFHVIVRPHYHTRRLTPGVVDKLFARFCDHPRFESIEQMGETDSLFRSDLLICDWSAMAIEYALGLHKPVLFVDLPRRIRNPDWQTLQLEPLEVSIRERAGRIVAPSDMDTISQTVREMLAQPELVSGELEELSRQIVYNPGQSVVLGAAEIARLAGLNPVSGKENIGH